MKLLTINEPRTNLPEIAIGIDLGTTNSLIAVMDKEDLHIIDGITPSIVSYHEDGSVIVGQEVSNQLSRTTIYSIKRLMGKNKNDLAHLETCIAIELNNLIVVDQNNAQIKIRIGKQHLAPEQISAEILAHLKMNAEKILQRPVTKAVITVPAHFDDAARNATKEAARLANLQVLRLLNEPTAAALAYGLDKKLEGVYMVYDLGGGTFDVSILRMTQGVFQVLSTGGDTLLGGDDFDKVILQALLAQFSDNGNLNIGLLRKEAKNIKELLSIQEKVEHAFEMNNQTMQFVITRLEFEKMIGYYIDRTIQIVKEVLEDAKLSTKDILGVVLVGGATRTPLVKKKITEFFNQSPLSDIDPDRVVALGAALQAKNLSIGSEHLLLDVTPLSLGIEILGGVVEKIIPRNTPIPASYSHEFTTYQDDQRGMKFHIVQGEREMATHCRSLAQFELSNIPPLQAGVARVNVIFSVDADSILTVSAIEKTTGIKQQITVKPNDDLNEEKIIKNLKEAADYAIEDAEMRLIAEARTKSVKLLENVKKSNLITSVILNEEEKQQIVMVIKNLEVALQGSDRKLINNCMEDFEICTAPLITKVMNKYLESTLQGKKINEAQD